MRATIDTSGVPTILIDGRPHSGWMYTTNVVDERLCRDVGRAGVDLYSFHVSPNYNPKTRRITWTAPDEFDFSEMDELFATVLRANPGALFVPRVFLFSPPWWNEQHPDELMRYADGETFKPTRRFPEGTELPSWSSRRWREDTAFCLRRMIAHAREAGYGSRIVGYHLASGGSDEWYYYSNYRWFFGEPLRDFLDYGPAQLTAFRLWLRERYSEDTHALRSAWGVPDADFETAALATPDEKTATERFAFRDPAASGRALDTFRFEADVIADTIDFFAGVVKEATGGDALAGAFYGYLLGAVDMGYCATRRLLQSEHVDFLCAPSGYGKRELATGVSYHRAPVASIQLHGKLWWEENDYYTHLTSPRRWVEGFTGALDARTTRASQLRQLAHQICTGSSAWWYDMDGGWYDETDTLAMVAEHAEIASRAAHCDRSSIAEVAVVVDEESMFTGDFAGELYRSVVHDQIEPIARVGAPVDWLLLDDLPEARDYRLYVFLNAFYLTRERRERLHHELTRRNGSRLWVYAPGYLSERADPAGAASTCGVRLAATETKMPLRVEIDSATDPLPGVPPGHRYGTDRRLGPVFTVDDAESEPIGTLLGTGMPGLVRKLTGEGTTYYSAAPTLSAAVLRGIATEAGVHVYTAGDETLWANASFVALHAMRSGTHRVTLPDPVVFDPIAARELRPVGGIASLELEPGETALLYRGSEEDWSRLQRLPGRPS